MPTIQLTVPKGAWSKEEKAAIAKGFTASLAKVGADSGKGDITPYINVLIDETAEGGYAMGGNVVG